jgi:hypothetical protein
VAIGRPIDPSPMNAIGFMTAPHKHCRRLLLVLLAVP